MRQPACALERGAMESAAPINAAATIVDPMLSLRLLMSITSNCNQILRLDVSQSHNSHSMSDRVMRILCKVYNFIYAKMLVNDVIVPI
jgi:hypothetical protein